MAAHSTSRLAVSLLLGAGVWFLSLVVVGAAAINYDEFLGYRMNPLGKSSPFWPPWQPWWGWYLMHGGAVAAGLVVAVSHWRSARTRRA